MLSDLYNYVMGSVFPPPFYRSGEIVKGEHDKDIEFVEGLVFSNYRGLEIAFNGPTEKYIMYYKTLGDWELCMEKIKRAMRKIGYEFVTT